MGLGSAIFPRSGMSNVLDGDRHMKTLEYPSKGFADAAKNLINEKEEFTVVVPKNATKKSVLLRFLPVLLTRKDHRNIFRKMLDMWHIRDLFEGVGLAVLEERYEMRYEDKGDLIIYFKPITKK
jgi:hypothetical protein